MVREGNPGSGPRSFGLRPAGHRRGASIGISHHSGTDGGGCFIMATSPLAESETSSVMAADLLGCDCLRHLRDRPVSTSRHRICGQARTNPGSGLRFSIFYRVEQPESAGVHSPVNLPLDFLRNGRLNVCHLPVCHGLGICVALYQARSLSKARIRNLYLPQSSGWFPRNAPAVGIVIHADRTPWSTVAGLFGLRFHCDAGWDRGHCFSWRMGGHDCSFASLFCPVDSPASVSDSHIDHCGRADSRRPPFLFEGRQRSETLSQRPVRRVYRHRVGPFHTLETVPANVAGPLLAWCRPGALRLSLSLVSPDWSATASRPRA